MTKKLVLFQERWRRRPFWMAAGSLLVNKTQWKNAKAVHAALVARYRTHGGLARASLPEVESIVRGLGLGKQRAKNLVGFARAYSLRKAYVGRRPLSSFEIGQMPGCGKYATDSWAIFVEGVRPPGVEDKKLLHYLKNNPLPRQRSLFKDTRAIVQELREC